MSRAEIIVTLIGTIFAVLAVIRYVVQIFKMPKEKRLDFRNLVKPKGTWRSNPVNFVFLLGVILLVIGVFIK